MVKSDKNESTVAMMRYQSRSPVHHIDIMTEQIQPGDYRNTESWAVILFVLSSIVDYYESL